MQITEYQKLYRLEESHWWYRGLRELILSALQMPNRGAEFRVLDAGCGTGGLLSNIQEHFRAVGLDLKEEALLLSKKKGLQLLIRGSVEGLPFPAESFDSIVSLDVLYHSEVADDEVALREFHRVIKPSGELVLNLPAYRFLLSAHDKVVHSQRRYTKRNLAKKLKATGFQIQKITYRNFFLFPPIFVWRMFRKAIEESDSSSDLFYLPPIVNLILLQIIRCENFLLKWISFPFGTSIFCIARKA
jgi:ubiquinone/menaquinone biosynthesis C-methylase UbiE